MRSKTVVMIESQGFVGFEGTYPRMLSTAKCLCKEGYDVRVIGWDRDCKYPSSESVEGIQVERIGVKTGDMRGPIKQFLPMSAFFFKAFWRLMRCNFNVIHCHNIDVLPLAYISSLIKKAKLVFEAHEPDYYAFWPKKWRIILRILLLLEKFFSKKADCVIVTSSYQVEKYKSFGVKKTILIGNYPTKSLIVEKLAEEKFLKEEIVFGRIGTIYQGVGVEEIVTAFQRLTTKYENIRLYFAGRILEGYREEFDRLIAPIRDKVKGIGAYPASEIKMHYRKIDVSIMPYHKNEWFKNINPTKFYDSLANAVPVIITDIGGVGDVIRRHDCGLIIDENDIPGIEKAMEILITDAKLRKNMAQNGLKAIKENYTWDLMEKSLKKIYEEL